MNSRKNRFFNSSSRPRPSRSDSAPSGLCSCSGSVPRFRRYGRAGIGLLAKTSWFDPTVRRSSKTFRSIIYPW